jgi:hypothetical protein
VVARLCIRPVGVMLPGGFGRTGAVAAMHDGSLKVYPLEKCAKEIQSIVLECGNVSTGQRRGGPNGYASNTKQVHDACYCSKK